MALTAHEKREKAEAELKKLKTMSPMSAEATVVRNYLDWMLSIPWGVKSRTKKDLRKAFQEFGALYAMYWALDGDEFVATGDYENPSEKAMQQRIRGDGETFVKLSRELKP